MAPKKRSSNIVDSFDAPKQASSSLRYPQCLREAPKLDRFFIPVTGQESRFVLGPVFFPNSPAELTSYYPVNNDEPLLFTLSGLERIGWENRGTIRSWPTVFPDWVQWVDRMTLYLSEEWRNMRITAMIEFSTHSFACNSELLSAIACFWSTSSNVFVFKYGPMAPTVLDIVYLTGLPCTGLEVNALLTSQPYPPPLFEETTEKNWSYSKLLASYRQEKETGPPSIHEKIAFYLYWLNKYLFCVAGLKVTKEYIRLATCLAQNTQLSLAPYILGILYKGLFSFTQAKITSSCGGPFWILQAWTYAYFPAISPHLLPKPFCQSYVEHFLSSELSGDCTFKRYFSCFYSPQSSVYFPSWLPFSEVSYPACHWVKSIFDLSLPTPFINDFWASILISRFIPIGFSPSSSKFSHCSFEIYFPNQVARQFGLSLGIPVPYTHPRIKDNILTRPDVVDTSIISEIISSYQEACIGFAFQPFVADPLVTKQFEDWWSAVMPTIFPPSLENCLSRLDIQPAEASKRTKRTAPMEAHLPQKKPKTKPATRSVLASLIKDLEGPSSVDEQDDDEPIANLVRRSVRQRLPVVKEEMQEIPSSPIFPASARSDIPQITPTADARLGTSQVAPTDMTTTSSFISVAVDMPSTDRPSVQPIQEEEDQIDQNEGCPTEIEETLTQQVVTEKGQETVVEELIGTEIRTDIEEMGGDRAMPETEPLIKQTNLAIVLGPMHAHPIAPSTIMAIEEVFDGDEELAIEDLPSSNIPSSSHPPDEFETPTSEQTSPGVPHATNEDLEDILSKVKSFSEICSTSFAPPSSYQLSQEAKETLVPFFSMLELPLAVVATTLASDFMLYIDNLVAKEVLPLQEHAKLMAFKSDMDLPSAASCHEEINKNNALLHQLSDIPKTLGSISQNVQQVRGRLDAIALEKEELRARLQQLDDEEQALLSQTSILSGNLSRILQSHEDIGPKIQTARKDLLRNQEKFNVQEMKWKHFVTIFSEFKAKIQ